MANKLWGGNAGAGGGLSTTQQAAKFVGVSVLAGAVLAGIALPATGALGLAAKGSVESFDEIPATLKRPPLSQKTSILDSEGGQMATVVPSRDRTMVGLKDVSPYMRKAIVAIEDARFYHHGAVDPKGILRALNKNAQNGGVSQGASTLTQQYVKNVFVEEAGNDPEKVAEATQQTLGRKVKELKYAIQVEKELGKKKILENYLNITFFGQQAYGVEAAAQRYFSTSAKNLSLPQSALLAGLVQSPSRYDPVNDPREATKRRNTVLQRMADVRDITQAQADKAKAQSLGLSVSKPKSGCITATNGAGFFCDYVREVFLQDKAFGKTKEDRLKRWNQGGLTIRTTLDPQAQGSVQKAISNHVRDSDKVATAVTLVEPGTGKILGMGQSRPYGFKGNQTQINLSVPKEMGGSAYGFQVGSTFKAFTAAAALEKGMPTSQSYPSPNKMPYPSPVQTCNGTWENKKGVTVQNETKEEVGPYGLKEATAKSINTYFVAMIGDIGVCPVTTLAGNMGVKEGNGGDLPQSPGVTLGTATIAPLTMAGAYATFASGGTYCTPVAIESVTDVKGKQLAVPKTTCKRVMSQKTASTLNTLLRGVVEDGTGKQAGLQGRDSAGKTGTTDERKAAWFVGYTPNMAGAVWVGSPNNSVSMENITIGGQFYPKVFGGGVPGPIWRDAMSGALTGKPAPTLPTVPIADPKDKKKPGDDKHDKPGKGDKPSPPDVSLPPGFIGGTDGGGHGGGHGRKP